VLLFVLLIADNALLHVVLLTPLDAEVTGLQTASAAPLDEHPPHRLVPVLVGAGP
jgi:hypothetical protein